MSAVGYVSTTGDARKVTKAGDTMTGELVLPDSSPDTALAAASKGYVDGQVSTRAAAATQVFAGTGLTGGGTLAADRTLAVVYGTGAGTAAQGNDSRIAGALQSGAAAGGDLAGTYPSPTLSGTANVNSIVRTSRLDQMAAPTAAVGLNSQKITGLANGTAAGDGAAFGQIPIAGTTAGTYAVGNDFRLSDARTPTAHASTHASGGSDPVTSAAIGAALSSDLPYPQAAYSSNRRLPQWRQPATVITTFQSGHGWTNNAGSTIVTNDTADFILGTQACKLTSGGAGASANLTKLAMSTIDTTGKAIRLRLKIDDITHMTGLNFFLGSSSLANTYKWIVQGGVAGSNFVTSGDWLVVTLNWHDATTTGSPARNAITDARLQIVDDATATVTLHANSVELIADASATFPNGVVSITFDDSYQSVYDYGMPKLATYGYPASVYTIQDLIGGSGRFTLAELKTLQDLHGWETASHANTDSDHSLTYTGMTAAALDADLRALKAWGDAQGFRGSGGTAYPLGQYGRTTDNASTTDIVRRYFDYARTTNSKTKETFPPADAYRLRAISSISTFTGGYAPATLTTASTGDLDKAKANQSWLILVFHKITTGAPAALTEISQTDFNSIIDNINSRGMTVLPIGDVLRYYV